VCAWCGEPIDGGEYPSASERISHSICPTCAESQRRIYRERQIAEARRGLAVLAGMIER
jgi:hypothetical protein